MIRNVVVRALGVLAAVAGAGLALYSFPFVTFVAFGMFLAGVGALVWGLWMAGGHRLTR